MATFLLPMLDLVPAERANAGGMSNHSFLSDTKGMEDVKLDIQVGSKGEGIEGWATEVKKQR
jgi:serine/threonine-protein kinase SRPK3